MKVFADTSGLFAALSRTDEAHEQARLTLEALLRRDMPMHTTSYTLIELLALLERRIGGGAAERFDSDLRPLLAVTWIDEATHEKVMKAFHARKHAKASIVDCAAFVCMRAEGIRRVFTLDGHFEAEGFEVLLSPADV